MSTRYFRCVTNPSHLIAMEMNDTQYNKMVRLLSSGRAVCSHCKAEGVSSLMKPCDPPETESQFGGGHTLVACRHGHTTKVSAFSNGMLHVKWGDDDGQFENIEGVPEEIPELVDTKAISCNHTIERSRGWARCGCKLKVVKGKAETPQATFVKTKVRIGDIWDKNKIARPSEGRVDKDGNYHPSELEKRHTERIRDMKESGSIKVFDEKEGKWKRRKRKRLAKPKGGSEPTNRHENSPSVSGRQAKKSK